ncbi:MAG: FeoA family protein [Acholeplasmataceae bacterium]
MRHNRVKPQRLEKVALSQLKKHQKGKVISLKDDDRVLRRRLLDMGITEGVMIMVKKVAPLGDPVDILVRGYELCLRKKDMDAIWVEVCA